MASKKNTKKPAKKVAKKISNKVVKKNKHISDISTKDLSEHIMGKLPTPMKVDMKEWKAAQKDYDKYYKLGKMYAEEFNKISLAKRSELAQNRDQQIGWTDGFVDNSFTNFYKGLDDLLDYNNMVVATLRSRGISLFTNSASSPNHGPVYEVTGLKTGRP